MGLDLYCGSLTRYHVGDWFTVVAQAAMASGVAVRVERTEAVPTDAIHDPDLIHEAVLAWRRRLGEGLGIALDWPEDGGAAYETDKPDWDGYGAVVLLAAYDDHPHLNPTFKKHRFARTQPLDDPRRFPDSPAYKAIEAQPELTRYPSIVLNAEWWLPAAVPAVFDAPAVNGATIRMGSVGRLLSELRLLNERTLQLTPDAMASARHAGPPAPPSTVDSAASFGLSVWTSLAEWADGNRQPLLMDY